MVFANGFIKRCSTNFTELPSEKRYMLALKLYKRTWMSIYIDITTREHTRGSGVREELSWKLSLKGRKFITIKIWNNVWQLNCN
jgi:hypothetical protein